MADPGQGSRRRLLAVAALALGVLPALVGCGILDDGALSGTRRIEYRPSGLRYGSLALAPDRRQLAVERLDHDRAKREIVLLPLDGSATAVPRVLAEGASPEWLSDSHILFSRDDPQGRPDLWTASVHDAVVRPLTRTAADERSVSIAADGQRVLIARAIAEFGKSGLLKGFRDAEIVLARIAEEGLGELVVLARVDAERGAPSSPEWSPDGRQFAYVRETPGRNDLYVMDSDGSGDRLLARDAVPLAWTPDGRSIVYGTRSSDAAKGEVRLIGVDGRGDQLVLADTHVPASGPSGVQWDAAGERLAVATDIVVGGYGPEGYRERIGIVVLDADGRVRLDLRRSGERARLEGRILWDWRDRLVFARHVAVDWSDQGLSGGVYTRDLASGEERAVLIDTESYQKLVRVP